MSTATPLARPWSAPLLRRLAGTPAYRALALLRGRRVVIGGGSMYPLLHPGDHVLFDRLAFHVEPPRRGDVVLVEPAAGPEQRLVKLVAGLPREHVAVARDRLWVDGRPLDLPDPRPIVGSLPGAWQLGPAEYFLLSYAVAVGWDSRHFGPVARGALRGRAWLVYWPTARRRRLSRLALKLGGPVEEPA
ncbi:MAG: signal peptidase I [Chloroflexi bacterium]|nr:signal peptidase I [Chloroflexota bacterium]